MSSTNSTITVNGPDYKNAFWAYYRYAPTLAGAIIFAIIFFLTTALHVVQMWKTRTWYLIAFVLGGVFEFIGYSARSASAAQEAGYWTLIPYIIQSIFLLVAPALYAASIYMILGRIIILTDGVSHSLIKPRWLTGFFVFGDVLSFLMQSSGGGLMAQGNSLEMGEHIIVGGLVLQLVFFAFFILVAAIFHVRLSRVPTARSQAPEIRWHQYLHTLYVVSVLIMIRNIFRVVEYVQGNKGYILSHEVFLYIFDALLMLTQSVWMNWRHPSEIGLLLRGERPISNGFLLTTVRPKTEAEASSAV